MGAPPEEAGTLRLERGGALAAVGWPEAPSSDRSMSEPASAPTWEPSVAPVSVAPRIGGPAGGSALPTAAAATARARVAMGGEVRGQGSGIRDQGSMGSRPYWVDLL